MKTPILALAALALFAAGSLLALPARRAAACSTSATRQDIFQLMDVVVEGTITGWRPLADPDRNDAFTPIALTMTVDRTFKGTPGATLELFDRASLTAGAATWAGSAGACGAFDFDPTGHHLILGLSRDPAGNLTANRISLYYMDEYSSPRELLAVRAELQGFAAAPVAPGVGNAGLRAPSAGSAPEWPLPAAGAALILLASAAGFTARRR